MLKDFSSCDDKVHRDNSGRRQYLAMVESGGYDSVAKSTYRICLAMKAHGMKFPGSVFMLTLTPEEVWHSVVTE